MKQDSDTGLNTAIKREATDWWVRLDGGELDQKQQQLFQDWLSKNPAHARAFADVSQLWGELDAIKSLLAIPVTPKQQSAINKTSWIQTLFRPGIVRWSTALAICCMLFWLSPFGLLFRADFHTSIGEMRTLQLSDGSTVMLNSDSALAVSMAPNARQISLLKGEALFRVSPDKSRPFSVHAGDGSVTALGTAFNIRLRDGSTEVTVTEHSVAVNLDKGFQTTRLEEGQSLSYDQRHGISAAQTADTSAITAWQRGKLVFQDKPLGEVIAELNRYHRGHLMISDNRIAERRVNGVFHINDPLAVISALQNALQIKSTHISDYLILLHQ